MALWNIMGHPKSIAGILAVMMILVGISGCLSDSSDDDPGKATLIVIQTSWETAHPNYEKLNEISNSEQPIDVVGFLDQNSAGMVATQEEAESYAEAYGIQFSFTALESNEFGINAEDIQTFPYFAVFFQSDCDDLIGNQLYDYDTDFSSAIELIEKWTECIYGDSNATTNQNQTDNPIKAAEEYILIASNGKKNASLIDKNGSIVHFWNFTNKLGNDFQLLPNGDLLCMFKREVENSALIPNERLRFGGFGGSIQIIGPDGSVKWRYDHFANATVLAHHDVEMLPNGNVLVMVWEELNMSDAHELGVDAQSYLYYESLYEINISSNMIVWQWRSIDHIVQDRYPELPNYGNVSLQSERIDFNYNVEHENYGISGDIMHANGIDYDEERGLIYLSVNFYHEIWVIDHLTNTEEAASSSGGNYEMGGDLVYRFGNPGAYKATGPQLFINNHYPNLIEDPGKSGFENILVFSNGGDTNISSVLELELPVLDYPTTEQPNIEWSFSDPALYSGKLSGAERTRSNNTIIAEGDFGVWEVTTSGEVLWRYEFGNTWRAYVHYSDEPGIMALLSS